MNKSLLDEEFSPQKRLKDSFAMKSTVKFFIALACFFLPFLIKLSYIVGLFGSADLGFKDWFSMVVGVGVLVFFAISARGLSQAITAFRRKEPFGVKYVGLIGNGLNVAFFLAVLLVSFSDLLSFL